MDSIHIACNKKDAIIRELERVIAVKEDALNFADHRCNKLLEYNDNQAASIKQLVKEKELLEAKIAVMKLEPSLEKHEMRFITKLRGSGEVIKTSQWIPYDTNTIIEYNLTITPEWATRFVSVNDLTSEVNYR